MDQQIHFMHTEPGLKRKNRGNSINNKTNRIVSAVPTVSPHVSLLPCFRPKGGVGLNDGTHINPEATETRSFAIHF